MERAAQAAREKYAAASQGHSCSGSCSSCASGCGSEADFVAPAAEVDPEATLLPRDVRLRAIVEAMSRFERGHEPSPAQLAALDCGWKLFLRDYGK